MLGNVVFLRGNLDDTLANSAIAQLFLASRTMTGQPTEIYIDCQAGAVASALALYDVVQTLGTPVSTTCIGTVGGAAVLVLAGGTRGRRFALPHARIHLSDDPVEWMPSGKETVSDPATLAEEARRTTARWRAALLQHVTQSPSQLTTDMAASRWLTASEAKDYGLIDDIVLKR
jgi:ATP-dependent Clp protease protease subunit